MPPRPPHSSTRHKASPTAGPLHLLSPLPGAHSHSLCSRYQRPSLTTQYTHTLTYALLFFLLLITTQHLFICLLSVSPTRMQAPREKGLWLFACHCMPSACDYVGCIGRCLVNMLEWSWLGKRLWIELQNKLGFTGADKDVCLLGNLSFPLPAGCWGHKLGWKWSVLQVLEFEPAGESWWQTFP